MHIEADVGTTQSANEGAAVEGTPGPAGSPGGETQVGYGIEQMGARDVARANEGERGAVLRWHGDGLEANSIDAERQVVRRVAALAMQRRAVAVVGEEGVVGRRQLEAQLEEMGIVGKPVGPARR